MYFLLLEKVDFHCYVRLPEGIAYCLLVSWTFGSQLVQLFSQRKNQTLDLDPSKFYGANNSRDESGSNTHHSFQEGQRCKVLNFSMKVTRWWSHFF